MGLTLVTAPTEYPVTLDEMKEFLRVEHDEHDDRITKLIAGETAFAEDFTGRALVPQTWDYTLDAFPAQGAPQTFELPLPRVISLGGVFYLDADGAEQTLDAATYVSDLTSQPARIALAASGAWPTTLAGPGSVRVRFTAGEQDGSVSPATPNVRQDIQLGIMFRVQADYYGGDRAKELRDTSEIYLRRGRVHLALA